MYDSATSRPRKTQITRVKSGCLPCRRKRRKCDEQKPNCRRCVNSKAACKYATSLEFRDATEWAADKVNKRAGARPPATLPSPSSQLRGSVEEPSICTEVANDEINVCYADNALPGDSSLPFGCDEVLPELPKQAESLASAMEPMEGVQSIGDPSPNGMAPAAEDLAIGNTQSTPREQELALESSNIVHPLSSNDLVLIESDFLQLDNIAWDLHETWPETMQGLSLACSWDSYLPMFPDISLPETCHEPESLIIPTNESTLQTEQSNPENNKVRHEVLIQDHCLSKPDIEIPILSPPQSDFDNSQPSPETFSHTPTHPVPSAIIPIPERRYLAHFTTHISDTLPAPMPTIWQTIAQSSLVRQAAIALAAANLANQQGKQRSDAKGTWQVSKLHAETATKYASLCWDMLGTDANLPLDVRITAYILLVCLELEIGAVYRLRQALSAITTIMAQQSGEALAHANCHCLVRNYLHLHQLEVMITHPQDPILSESPVEPIISRLMTQFAATPQVIDRLGSSALKICQRILLTHCLRRRGDSTLETLDKMAQWRSILTGKENKGRRGARSTFNTVLEEEDLYCELKTLRGLLKDYTSHNESHMDRPWISAPPASAKDIKPMLFDNHREAMSCADLMMAHLACNEDLIRSLTAERTDSQHAEKSRAVADLWASRLAQIAAGLDPIVCQQRNMYRKGIILYLHLACLLSGNPVFFEFLDIILQRSINAGAFCEGSFAPIHVFWAFNRTLQRDIAANPGRRIFMAEATYTSLTSREILFSKGRGEHILICGRDGGEHYFSDMISVEEPST